MTDGKSDLTPPKKLKYATAKSGKLASPIEYADTGLRDYLDRAPNRPGSPHFLELHERSEHDRARFWAMWTRRQRDSSAGATGQYDE